MSPNVFISINGHTHSTQIISGRRSDNDADDGGGCSVERRRRPRHYRIVSLCVRNITATPASGIPPTIDKCVAESDIFFVPSSCSSFSSAEVVVVAIVVAFSRKHK